MTRGATLLELLLALAILAILLALGAPAAIAARDRSLVALQAHHLAAAHLDTRTAARLAGARAELVVTATGFHQRTWRAGGFLPSWSRPGPASDGVTLSGPATPMIFDSRGFMLGVGNRTYHLSRGSASTQVVRSRRGRLRIVA
ncbi:MAG: prepilin-type N-terminal cleavage/methylation domain-containing protein [Gemmatimonadales bacterium]|nr:prepilin-type N-terminal cleavage/methylation domain-containing protein [Gemmatimonadales bacterium]